MSIIETSQGSEIRISNAGAGDFIALMKPRVMSLVVFTALTGLVIAPGSINPFIGFVSILAIAVGAGASGALNQWYEADIDAIMSRTKNRPDSCRQADRWRGAVLWLDPVVAVRDDPRPVCQLVGRGAAGFHHFLLRGILHDVAEARDTAKHRDRRCRRCYSRR